MLFPLGPNSFHRLSLVGHNATALGFEKSSMVTQFRISRKTNFGQSPFVWIALIYNEVESHMGQWYEEVHKFQQINKNNKYDKAHFEIEKKLNGLLFFFMEARDSF